MDSDLVPLDASLELLDDVEGFDLVPFGSEQGRGGIGTSTCREVPNDEDRDLLQQLEIIGDLDADLWKLIPDPDVAEDSERDASSATIAAQADLPCHETPIGVQKSTRKLRHQRKKNELEYLRKQVVDLVKELEGVKRSSGSETQKQGALLLPRGDDGASEGVSLWERVAKNQRDERVKAEVENVKLRERLEGQLKLAQSLEKLLCKRRADEDVEGAANQKMRARKLAGLREPEIFEMLSDRVDGLYTRVDVVMSEAGLASLKRERNDARVKFDKTGRVCVEMVDAKISPFAVHHVAEAAWTILGTKRIELGNGYYKALECTNDTVKAEFCVALRLRRAEALVRMHILGKRLVEEHRVVMVWATFGQTEGAPFGMERINLSEFGWTVVEAVTGERSAYGDGTITQSCVRLTPELDDAAGQTTRVGVLSDLVIGSYSLNMQTMHQEVENCLLRAELA
ncbi:hypothetical protein PRIC1_012652 [Phytophthora ramorum]